MRKCLLTFALVATALAAGASGAEAGYRTSGYGYSSGYDSGYSQSYYRPVCHTITVRTYDPYSYRYVYSTRRVCN